jgi:photosystem II stability/assembly factor-like uncharacterized protein
MGLFVSRDGGERWTKLADTVRFQSPIGIAPLNPLVIYAEAQSGIVKSADGGKTWSPIGEHEFIEQRPLYVAEQRGVKMMGAPVTVTVRQFAIDPMNDKYVYIVSNKGIYRSTDGGNTWCLLNTGMDFIESYYSLAFDPANTASIFVGTRFGVFSSGNRGDTFKRLYPQIQ